MQFFFKSDCHAHVSPRTTLWKSLSFSIYLITLNPYKVRQNMFVCHQSSRDYERGAGEKQRVRAIRESVQHSRG